MTVCIDWCQRPKRAFFISTLSGVIWCITIVGMCQRPKRAFFISTEEHGISAVKHEECQRPKRAFFISTKTNLG